MSAATPTKPVDARALAYLLEDIAARLDAARTILNEPFDAGAAREGALALIAHAGALADRASRALGGDQLVGTVDDWSLGSVSRESGEGQS